MKDLNEIDVDEVEEFSQFCLGAPIDMDKEILFRYWRFGFPVPHTWKDIPHCEIELSPLEVF